MYCRSTLLQDLSVFMYQEEFLSRHDPKTHWEMFLIFQMFQVFILCVVGGNGTPYCNQSNTMSVHHGFPHNQSGPEHLGSGDGETALALVLTENKIKSIQWIFNAHNIYAFCFILTYFIYFEFKEVNY